MLGGPGRYGADSAPLEDGILDQGLQILRKRKWVFVQAVLVVTLATLGFSLSQEKAYTATATLYFNDPTQGVLDQPGGSFVDPSREAATNERLVNLPVVAQRAAVELGRGVTGEQVAGSVTIESSGDADLVDIGATAPSGRGAADMANAYANAYIAFRRETGRGDLREAARLVESTLAGLPPARRAGAEGAELRSRLERLRLAESLQTGKAKLVQRAQAPDGPSSPKTKRNVILGLLMGSILGFAIAALFERLDRRLRTVEEVEQAYQLPVLARIPRSRLLRRGGRGASSSLPAGAEAEAFRTLRANLRYFSVDRRMVRSILVASAVSGEGKSTVARMLALSMASMGDRVVLVETDLHKNGAGRSATAATDGLSAVLAGGDLDESLLELDVPVNGSESQSRVLMTLPAGPLPPNPSELLESARMGSLIAELEERFDVVILDSAPLSMVTDAFSLVPEVSGVIVVSGLGQTTRNAATDLRKQLSLLGGRPLGIVANFAKDDHGAYYGSQGRRFSRRR